MGAGGRLTMGGTPTRVLLAGASGMIGGALRAALHDHPVRVLVRRPPRSADEVSWDPAQSAVPVDALNWADAVVSLGGASLTKLPWNHGYRDLLVSSRVASTEALARAIAAADDPPRTWISASAVGAYGDRPDEMLSEDSARGAGLLADLVAQWEGAAQPAAGVTRLVFARTGIVLGRSGALVPLVGLARLGLGGRIGTGHQFWPWISLADEVRAIVHLIDESTLHGPVNLVSPGAATAGEITAAVARALRRPHVVPAPAWLLRLVLGDAARDLLLADQHVHPARLIDDGFQFADTNVAVVVAALVGRPVPYFTSELGNR